MANTIMVTKIAHHRNGVGGQPFYVVLFEDRTPEMVERPMFGILFDSPRHIAVLDAQLLAQGSIQFGINSWRGDWFEPALRQAIAEHWACFHSQQICPICR